MPVINDQVELSRAGVVRSSYCLFLWTTKYHATQLAFQEHVYFHDLFVIL